MSDHRGFVMALDEADARYEAMKQHLDKAVAHRDRLAEALRGLLPFATEGYDPRWELEKRLLYVGAVTAARKALGETQQAREEKE